MDALKNIPEFVKATQFIGQSSGKASKGQSQKAQQVVLEKFRSGDYNVIVATSIGEEGLDIMEVGLVICFDANVSPLRMIQRMGRTGRKHEGRVVVLACEGSELKGYTQKQANCKTINKHMRNGGVNSFNFHSSPRMIPHIFKPEVHYARLSIEQFVPRGKKVLEDHVVQKPEFKMELTSAEHDLLKKYYHSTPEKLWRPSLIAFPHFQAIPSRVHTIKHSLRSLMLIDTMQYLQGLKYSRDNNLFIEDDPASDLCLSFDNARPRDRDMEDLQTFHDSLEVNSESKALESHVDPSQTEEMHFPPEFQKKKSSVHSYLFGSDFVSVDPLGRVLVMSLPVLPLKKNPHSKFTNAGAFDFKVSLSEYKEEIMHVKCDNDFGTRCDGNENMRVNCESPRVVETKMTVVLDCNDSCNDFRDVELSPRLTNLLMSGIVPESPTDDTVISEGKRKGEFLVQDLDSHSELQTELFLKSSVLEKNDNIIKENSANERDVQASSINGEIQISTDNGINNSTRPYSTLAVVEEVGTPPENPSPNSCSKDWHIDSGGSKSESIRQECKFKRLRKYGDIPKMPSKEKVEYRGSTAELARSHKRGGGGKKIVKDVRAFIDTQAEVSGGTPVSEDDEDEQDNNSYDDSFIDDRINTTGASTQAESSRRDMMAIYRRSLLSQSPMERLPNSFTDYSPDSVGPTTRINESMSSAGTTRHSLKSLQTPYTGLESGSTGLNSACSQLNPEKSNVTQREDVENTGSRKRKLSFYQNGSLPIQNLEQEFLLQCEAANGGDVNVHGHIEKDKPMRNEFDDDDLFFEGIDLDAVEEQATNYLKHKSELSGQNQTRIPHPQTGDAMDSPSFDLGF